MAIAIDTNSSAFGRSTSGATSYTFTYTSSGSDRYVLVFGLDVDGSGLTSATYNGTSMSALGNASRGPANVGSLVGYVWGLHAQSTTSSVNVVQSRTSGTNWIEGAAISLTGALQQTTPIDASTFTQGPSAGSTKSGTVTTVTDNSAVFFWVLNDNGGLSGFSGGTFVMDGAPTGFSTASKIYRSTIPFTPAGAATLSWSQNGTGSWFFIGVAIAPAGGSASQIKTWDGVTQANVKEFLGATNAQTKTWDGVTNV